MTESVLVYPLTGNDTNGDPVGSGSSGSPIELFPLEIAPGNMAAKWSNAGKFDDVEFSVYFPLRLNPGTGLADIETLIHDGDEIVVRGRSCTALLQVWRSQRTGGRGGAVVLARSRSGRAA